MRPVATHGPGGRRDARAIDHQVQPVPLRHGCQNPGAGRGVRHIQLVKCPAQLFGEARTLIVKIKDRD